MVKKFLSVLLAVLLASAMLSGCGLSVDRPEIKEARFDFSVTYEIDGETQTVSGVYVCEFDGVSWALDGGYSRDWTGYIEGEEAVHEMEIGTTKDGGKIMLAFGFHPAYFMGDPDMSYLEPPVPQLAIVHPIEGVDGINILGTESEIEEAYGVKIISYQYPDPIVNKFD